MNKINEELTMRKDREFADHLTIRLAIALLEIKDLKKSLHNMHLNKKKIDCLLSKNERKDALLKQCLEALEEISKQRMSCEMGDDYDYDSDFEYAYNELIKISRKALEKN